MDYADYTKFIRVVTPILTVFVGLIVTIFKLHLKRLENSIESETSKREKTVKDIMKTFNKGIMEERNHNQEVLIRLSKEIEDLIKGKVNKELCDEKHKK